MCTRRWNWVFNRYGRTIYARSPITLLSDEQASPGVWSKHQLNTIVGILQTYSMPATSFRSDFLKKCCAATSHKEHSWEHYQWMHARVCVDKLARWIQDYQILKRTAVASWCPSSVDPTTSCPACCGKYRILPAAVTLQPWMMCDIKLLTNHVL